MAAQSIPSPKRVVYLWGAGATHAEAQYLGANIFSIYLFMEELVSRKDKLSASEQRTFGNFVSQLWKRLREESRLGIDRANRELYSFQALLSSAPGEVYQIARRHEKLGEYYEYFKKKGKIKGDR